MATNNKRTIGISFATQYLELLIHFLATLALARILSPADVGVYSVAAFLMTLLHVFRDFGVVQYLIQENDLTAEKIRAAMGVAIILALTVAGILWASSNLVAVYYGNPAIKQILAVMAASFAISPIGSLLIGILLREMQLQKIFFIKIASALCHVAVAVVLACRGEGALSLAWANFAGILSFGIAANFVRPKNLPWIPRFTNIGTILSFGTVASLGNAANSAGTNIPDLVIGKVMSMSAVGYFSRANGIVQLFTKLITSALSPLTLPYFAQIRREGNDLALPYLSAVEYLTVLSWPFFATMMLLAYPIVRTLYGEQWDASIPLVELLCAAGAISSISVFAGQVMVANGQVRRSTFSQLIAQPLRVGVVLIASHYGLSAIAHALIGAELFALAIISWQLHKTIHIGLFSVLRGCAKSAVVALCTAIVPFSVRTIWEGDYSRPWLPLSIGLLGAAFGWVCGLFLTQHPLSGQVLALIKSLCLPRANSATGGTDDGVEPRRRSGISNI